MQFPCSYLQALQPGGHLCLIYDNEADQMAAIVPYLQEGLARREHCVYMTNEQTIAQVAAALCRGGLEATDLTRQGRLEILTAHTTYLRNGRFAPSTMIEFVDTLVSQALHRGFAGLRCTGQMTWALDSDAKELMEYEALLNAVFRKRPVTTLCQYNMLRFSPGICENVLRTHPQTIHDGHLCENLYYEPPDFVLSQNGDMLRIRWMLTKLKNAHITTGHATEHVSGRTMW
jgi:hypothetical protein